MHIKRIAASVAVALLIALGLCSVSALASSTATLAPLGNGFGVASLTDTQLSTDTTYAYRGLGGGGICSAFTVGSNYQVNGGLVDYGNLTATDTHTYNDVTGFFLTINPSNPDTFSVTQSLLATTSPTLSGNVRDIGYSGVTQGTSGLVALRVDGYDKNNGTGIAGNVLGTFPINQTTTTTFGTTYNAPGFTVLCGSATCGANLAPGSIGEHQNLLVSEDWGYTPPPPNANVPGYLLMARANFTTDGSGGVKADSSPHGRSLISSPIVDTYRGLTAINDTAKVIAMATGTIAGDPAADTDEYFRLQVTHYTDNGGVNGVSVTSNTTFSFRSIGDGNIYSYTNIYSRTGYSGPQEISINDNGDIAFPVVINAAYYGALDLSGTPYRTCPRRGILFMSHLTPGVFKLAVDNLTTSPATFFDDLSTDTNWNCFGGVAIDNDCNIYFSTYAWMGVYHHSNFNDNSIARTAAIYKASANDPVKPSGWTTEPILWRGCGWTEGTSVCSIYSIPVGMSGTEYYSSSASFDCMGINRTKLPVSSAPQYSVGGLFVQAGVDVTPAGSTTYVGHNRALYLAPTSQAPAAGSIDTATTLADGQPINLLYCKVLSVGGTYTAQSSGSVSGGIYYRYVVSQSTSSTLVISTIVSTLKVGDRIHVSGTMRTNTVADQDLAVGQKFVDSTGVVYVKPPAVTMSNNSIGTGNGLGTAGMWVRTFGQILDINVAGKYMDISDGSPSPLHVSLTGYTYPLTSLAAGNFISLTGHVWAGSAKTISTVNGDEIVKYY